MKIFLSFLLLAFANLAQAGLEVLDNDELQLVQGQAGADISLLMSLNHTSTYPTNSIIKLICAGMI